jgi:RNA polymerase primary sigma factor
VYDESLLTPEKEKELSNIILNSNDKNAKLKARNEMVLANLRLVVDIALKMEDKTIGGGDINLSLMDLIQAGNIGLMKAANKFDGKEDVRFVSYAYSAIVNHINETIKESRFVRLPIKFFKHMHEIKKLKEEYGDELTDKIIMKKLKIGARLLKSVKDNMQYSRAIVTSEDNPFANDIDSVISKYVSNDDISDAIDAKELREYMMSKINELKPRERDVLIYKFMNNDESTFKAVGKKFNITKQGCELLVNRAISNLRKKISTDTDRKKFGIGKIVVSKTVNKTREEGKHEKEKHESR